MVTMILLMTIRRCIVTIKMKLELMVMVMLVMAREGYTDSLSGIR